jgi:hypothetical protein
MIILLSIFINNLKKIYTYEIFDYHTCGDYVITENAHNSTISTNNLYISEDEFRLNKNIYIYNYNLNIFNKTATSEILNAISKPDTSVLLYEHLLNIKANYCGIPTNLNFQHLVYVSNYEIIQIQQSNEIDFQFNVSNHHDKIFKLYEILLFNDYMGMKQCIINNKIPILINLTFKNNFMRNIDCYAFYVTNNSDSEPQIIYHKFSNCDYLLK